MLEPAVPALFALPGNAAAALHGNYHVVSLSSPATMGETIALYATGLTVTLRNELHVADATPSIWMMVNPRLLALPAAHRDTKVWTRLDQINVQIPAVIHHGVVLVVMSSGSRTSNQVFLIVN